MYRAYCSAIERVTTFSTNFFYLYSLVILRSSLRCILEKWYRLVSFDHATFPHQEERTLEENCEQPDGRYRYVQKNLDEARTKDPMLKLIRFEKYGQRGQGICHVAIHHIQCVCRVHHIGYTNAYAEDYSR